MSLFSSIQQSSNALRVAQLGLQVTGNNVSNANTPGYIRQRLVQAPANGYQQGNLVIGQGVVAVGVQQQIDYFVTDRLRETQSQLSYQQSLVDGLQNLQDALNELGDQDISSALSRFSNSLQDVANDPQSNSVRAVAIRRGEELSLAVRTLSDKTKSVQQQATQEIATVSTEINRLTDSIANLNKRIVETEGGRISNSDAVGLRDERLSKMNELSELIDFKATEQSNGAVTIIVGGDYLVADGFSRQVKVSLNSSDSAQPTEIRLIDTDSKLNVTGGRLRGLYEQRTAVGGSFGSQLDSFAKNVINIVNRVHSQGQGSIGFSSVTGETVVSKPKSPLEQAAAGIDIDNGSFRIDVRDAATNTSKSYEINVRQLGDFSDTTAEQIASSINAIDGLEASIGNDGRFRIKSDSESISFSFAEDSSGALSALGINTFFVGDSASNISVRNELTKDSRFLAVSLDGPGSGARNALALTDAFTKGQSQLDGLSLQENYESFVARTAQDINSQQTITDGLQNFRNALEARHLGISGVSLDEEAANLLLYQRAFQASSRVISVANELFDTLVNIV